MTSFVEQIKTCAICGNDTEVALLASTNRSGYPDLDLRPPEMARSTIWMWLQECPNCGYCSEDIGEVEPGALEIVRGDPFIKLRESVRELHEVARRFRIAAFIAGEQGHHVAAFQHALREAWAHDDRQDTVRASAARLNAVDLMNQAHRDQIRLYDEEGADAAMAADLLRRVGEFTRSEEICQKALDEGCADHVQKVLEFELELCSARDAGCHTMEEVFRDSPAGRD